METPTARFHCGAPAGAPSLLFTRYWCDPLDLINLGQTLSLSPFTLGQTAGPCLRLSHLCSASPFLSRLSIGTTGKRLPLVLMSSQSFAAPKLVYISVSLLDVPPFCPSSSQALFPRIAE